MSYYVTSVYYIILQQNIFCKSVFFPNKPDEDCQYWPVKMLYPLAFLDSSLFDFNF